MWLARLPCRIGLDVDELEHKRWPLNAVVMPLAGRGRTGPGKIDPVETLGVDVGQLCRGQLRAPGGWRRFPKANEAFSFPTRSFRRPAILREPSAAAAECPRRDTRPAPYRQSSPGPRWVSLNSSTRSKANCSSPANVRVSSPGPPGTKTWTVAGLAPQKLGVSLDHLAVADHEVERKMMSLKTPAPGPRRRGLAENGEEIMPGIAGPTGIQVLLSFAEIVFQRHDFDRFGVARRD